jgi:short-subunit dehydrogenase
MKYSGKTVLITGASSGLGREYALEFHALGADVVLVARRERLLSELVEELNSQREKSARYFAVDLTDTSGGGFLPPMLSEFLSMNQIDILVNNAGFGSFGSYEELELVRERQMVELNVMAHMSLAHVVIGQMKERRSGGIITVSSIAGYQPLPYMATYAATKAFNLFHSLGLRYELAEFGVRALAVCPGPIATEFGGVARVPGTWSGGPRDTPELVVKESIRAFEKNRAVLVPCVRGKFMALPGKFLPLPLTTWIVGRTLRSVLKAAREIEST